MSPFSVCTLLSPTLPLSLVPSKLSLVLSSNVPLSSPPSNVNSVSVLSTNQNCSNSTKSVTWVSSGCRVKLVPIFEHYVSILVFCLVLVVTCRSFDVYEVVPSVRMMIW